MSNPAVRRVELQRRPCQVYSRRLMKKITKMVYGFAILSWVLFSSNGFFVVKWHCFFEMVSFLQGTSVILFVVMLVPWPYFVGPWGLGGYLQYNNMSYIDMILV